MTFYLILSLIGALLLWKLAYCRMQPDSDAPRPSARRIRVLGALGLAFQLPVLITMPMLLLGGQMPDLSSKVMGGVMTLLPAFFAVLGLRLLFGRLEPRQ